MKRLFLSGISALCLIGAAAAPAAAEQVLEQRSSWNAARDFIYTDVTVRQDDGRVVTRRQAGGVVGDVGMVQFHGVVGGPSGTGGLGIDFLRSTSEASGTQLRWGRSCVYVTPDLAGTTHIPGNDEFQIIADVLGHWEQSIASCSYLNFVIDEPEAVEAKYDGKNVIKFREDTWCRPASGTDEGQCYSLSAAAITTVFYVNAPGKDNDGVIRDADIEMNAVNFAVAVCSAPGQCQTEGDQSVVSDLANTLTHEVGHLLGMDHTCWDQPGVPPNDDDGVPVPQCNAGNLSSAVTEATMYNFQDSGETKKATVEQDDIDGLCDAYAYVADPGCCSRALKDCEDGGSCAIAAPQARAGASAPDASRQSATAAWMLVMILGGLVAWRRRSSVTS